MNVNPVTHQLADLLRLAGLRDRLRCPRCHAVGTWKPHGGWLDGPDTRRVRRWMCKCCGLYRGPEATCEVLPDRRLGSWQLAGTTDDQQPTPQALLRSANLWPWRG